MWWPVVSSIRLSVHRSSCRRTYLLTYQHAKLSVHFFSLSTFRGSDLPITPLALVVYFLSTSQTADLSTWQPAIIVCFTPYLHLNLSIWLNVCIPICSFAYQTINVHACIYVLKLCFEIFRPYVRPYLELEPCSLELHQNEGTKTMNNKDISRSIPIDLI